MDISRTAATVGAALLVPLATGISTAAADPIGALQLPAHSLVVSGLVVPGIHGAAVTVASVGPGVVTFAAPTRPEACATTYGGALVRIDYLNVATGAAGTTTVRPCTNFLDPTPETATVHTGPGPVLFTIGVTGSAYRPSAGQPSIPGVGTFTAP
ncbi:hypothetical protein HT102_09415 [Hoyosella sp. G463]|uniref:Uncharacterized protein n=1 Tax=Lolliginicoccus lacisalsi TaxID=2742202 RepID=A0A927PLD7_9ACTN|nr:hypothetical protein [Lolliginicoccus lacisalsi]MBD8506703.1 hypothetical protein [Lolliginicoccus lacisalsi]